MMASCLKKWRWSECTWFCGVESEGWALTSSVQNGVGSKDVASLSDMEDSSMLDGIMQMDAATQGPKTDKFEMIA